MDRPLVPIAPLSIEISGAQPTVRTVHQDPRGFLLETLRSDDEAIGGSHFRMSYSSVTMPGQYRDADCWHFHKVQTDRFVVILGEMTLALLDERPNTPSHGRLEVIRMTGVHRDELAHSPPRDITTYLVPIPPGVLHCIGNLGSEPFLLQNYPTELYNPADEGRVPFEAKPILALRRPFAWNLVNASRPAR